MHDGYQPAYARLPEADRRVIHQALELLKATVFGEPFDSPHAVKDYLTLRYADLGHEVFGALWLDAQHRLIAEDVLFRGTLSQTSVYPREVAKQALKRNAGAVVLFHNHPSGCAEPSRADEALTKAMQQALQLIDVRVLDHVVVAARGAVSFAERGLR
jgi:DNA repair protein RadC